MDIHMVGFDREEVRRAVCEWGNLPLTLREYYLQLGKHRRLNSSQNFLREPGKLIDAGDYLVFYIENLDCAEWGIKKSDLHKENPMVYCNAFGQGFQPECDTLTDFLNGMALFQAGSWGMTYACEDIFFITEEQAEVIRGKYKKKKCELSQWMRMSFYGNWDDEVIMMIENDGYDLLFGSEDEGHFREMEKMVEEMGVEAY